MNSQQLKELKKWFDSYVKSFYRGEPGFDENIALKEQHTYRVCNEIEQLGTAVALNKRLSLLAAVAALFHDLGRFEQYSRYRTFADRNSENHALLGIKVISEFNLLEGFPAPDAELITGAIRNHNLAEIPATAAGETALLSKLLRDADKLDIWKVVTDYYRQKNRMRNKSIELDLPESEKISDRVYQDVMAGRIVKNSDIRCVDDFKLLQLAWVFDLNFSHSLYQFEQRKYLELVADSITDKKKIAEVVKHIRNFTAKQLQEKKTYL